MRELKFRCWDKSQNKFIATGFHLIGETTLFDLLNSRKIEQLDNLVVQQYIGLKDKDGKDIYEGDVLHITDSKGKDYWYVIEFYEGKNTRKAYMLEGVPWYDDCLIYCKISKIIGNLSENPEMEELIRWKQS